MVVFVLSLLLLQSPPAACSTSDACRAEALIAEAAGQFETFHDLAWRAVQKGKPNDPELMTMLARAMALSGRPGDAIVMVERLADMGVKVDASGDEFRVVRTLNDWPRVAAKLAALGGRPVTDAVCVSAGRRGGARARKTVDGQAGTARSGCVARQTCVRLRLGGACRGQNSDGGALSSDRWRRG